MKIVWTPIAEERAAGIVNSMRADRTGAAWRWLQALLARLSALARTPNSCEGLYECSFAPCRIVYRVEPDRVVILALHAVDPHRKSARYEERPPGAPRAGRDRS